MKLPAFFLLAAALQVSAGSYGQTVTLSVKNAPMAKVFTEIEKQTGFSFVYADAQLSKTRPVDLEVSKANLERVLTLLFKDQPLTFTMKKKYVVVKEKPRETDNVDQLANLPPPPITVKGRITDEAGEPLLATVTVKGTTIAVSTNDNGEFVINNVDENATLVITGVRVETIEVKVNGKNNLAVSVKTAVQNLNEVIVNKGYYTEKHRLSTGNVSRIDAKTIEKQPVGNPLAVLQGRVPGLVINQSSGMPGTSFSVQIRGQNSLIKGSEPLFILDGVPLAANNNNINTVSITGSGLSPFNNIDPNSIESIEVLKDADATAIYGSRGANGVILITTKRGKSGKTSFSANIYTGYSQVTRKPQMLNTSQYLEMRKEAFANDGLIPSAVAGSAVYAPDLTIWDNTRYTNFVDLLMGGTARTTNGTITLTGGSTNTQFLLIGGYRKETTVFPGNFSDTRGNLSFNLNHVSVDRKFKTSFTTNLSSDNNKLIRSDLGNINLPPNAPSLYNADGKLNWQEGGVSFVNPMARFIGNYNAKTNSLTSNLVLGYNLLKGLTIKSSFGYSYLHINETAIIPIAAQDPNSSIAPTGRSQFGYSLLKGWTVEPQIEYVTSIGNNKLTVLVGGTWQNNDGYSSNINAIGYTSDELIMSLDAAPTIESKSNAYSTYRYQAFFGRLNYNMKDKYLINITGRRDGSSRFGPGNRFNNFGAVGAAWIFSSEPFLKKHIDFLSYGKLRTSYGITGNDQIGDYEYLDAWAANSRGNYQGLTILSPQRLLNADYVWERNKKYEAAVEIGFFNDRFMVISTYFNNKSDNQLVQYTLPSQVGFRSVMQNLPAIIQNSGWEFQLQAQIIKGKEFTWMADFNISLPKNKLIAFPGIETSPYANTYVVGEPVSVLLKHLYAGLDNNGVYGFKDIDGNGTLTSSADKKVIGSLYPKFYGGLLNSFSFMGIELDAFVEFRKQTGVNYRGAVGLNDVPGRMVNQPTFVLNRWQKPGDITNIQKFTATTTSAAYAIRTTIIDSDLMYGDASFIRLKNVSVAYKLPQKWIDIQSCKIFLRGQNLLTATNYKGSDPEIQNYFVLPPLRTFTGGILLTF